ncbi:MAG TPA: hypothetical protein VJ672_14770 [Gemmatimonadaceae bacterium]|nr:hypothetical protein [Gemmatimonadaceae bacterium]
MRGRLARYALYQLRDYVIERGLPTLLVGVILFLPVLFTLLRPGGQEIPSLLAISTLSALMPIFGIVAVLLGVNGMIANDRHRGYFRFIFAKPLSVTRYYLQAFAINGVGTIAMVCSLVFVIVSLAGARFPWGIVPYMALFYICAGGIGFLLSVLTRFDWVALGIIWALAQTLRQLAYQLSGPYYEALNVLLPPAHLMTRMAEDYLQGIATPTRTLVWVAGYGVLALLLGIAALRVRPLAP